MLIGTYRHIKHEVAFRRTVLRDHPLKTSAFLREGGVKNLPNLPTDSSKKLPTVRGVGVKNREKFADVLNGWSLMPNKGNVFAISFFSGNILSLFNFCKL